MRFSHTETRSLIWANNALVFDQGPARKCARDANVPKLDATDGWKYIEESFNYALQNYPETFRRTPRVAIDTFFSESDKALRLDVLSTMIARAERLPTVPFRFRDIMWRLFPQWQSDLSLMPDFLRTGRDLKAALTEAGHYKKPRNWTSYPSIPRCEDTKVALMKHLDEATGKEVLGWIENGI